MENVGDTEVARPVPLPEAVAHHTGFLLYKVAQYAQDVLDRALTPWGLRTRHFAVLAVLAQVGPRSQRELGGKLRIDRQTMVKVIDDLERLGLVERRHNRADRRLYDLTLTGEGRRVLTATEEAVATTEEEVFAPLGGARRDELHAALAALTAPTEQDGE